MSNFIYPESEDVVARRIITHGSSGKRLKLSIEVELCDSDDEFDEWFLESIPEKIGIRPRSLWVNPLNMTRINDGEYVRICLPLRKYPERFFQYYRMTISTHDFILKSIKESITKHSPRTGISPGERLAVTIRYLSTGMSFESIAQSFLMDGYTVGNIVHEVCEKIYEHLSPVHMAVPSKQDFKLIAAEYNRLWNFPNCVGSLDGKDIRIKRPEESGSIVLQAVADAHYRFIFIDVGAYGKQSDGGIFAASTLSKFIDDRSNFPSDYPVMEGLDVRLPYCFLCDDAYPLKSNMMKPFSGRNLSAEQNIYNRRLSRARRCVECAFGILANKWRLFLKAIETKKENSTENIVKAACVLHNVVIDREGIDEKLLSAVVRKIQANESKNNSLKSGRRYNHSSNSAVLIRNCWMKYFSSPAGSVPS
ncbi:uncharacterized protein LOC135840368 [Planococcus citri]|uniref:uncharacterized protein LOC135840368 n=1 Tax=Planococcus citri TaxID=170843 RepID=UPI0031F86A6A